MLFAGHENFRCYGHGAKGDGGYASVLDMCDDAADEVGVRDDEIMHLVRGSIHERIGLGEEDHGSMVKEAACYCGALDEPFTMLA